MDNHDANDWPRRKIEDVVEIHDSDRVPLNKDERAERPGSYPYYGATGQVDTLDDYIFDGTFVLLAEDGGPFEDTTRDTAYMVSGQFWANNHVHILRAKDSHLTNRFLLHALNKVDWRPHVTGTTRLKLTQGALREVEIPVPPIEVQTEIVARVDDLTTRADRARTHLERIPDLADKFKKSLLADAFSGELTREWRQQNPDVEPASELLERIRPERRRRWVENYAADLADRARKRADKKGEPFDEEDWQAYYEKKIPQGEDRYEEPEPVDPDDEDLPEIPETWEWGRVGMLGRIETGTTPSTSNSDYYGSYLPFIKPSQLESDRAGSNAADYLSEAGAEKVPLIPENSILVTCIGATIGKTSVADAACGTNQQINSIIPFDDFIDPIWLYRMVQSPVFQRQTDSHSSATTLPILNKSKLSALYIPIPPLSEQEYLRQQIETHLERIGSFERRISGARNQLSSLENAVLADVFAS